MKEQEQPTEPNRELEWISFSDWQAGVKKTNSDKYSDIRYIDIRTGEAI